MSNPIVSEWQGVMVKVIVLEAVRASSAIMADESTVTKELILYACVLRAGDVSVVFSN